MNIVALLLCLLFLSSLAQSESIEWPAYGGAKGGGHYTAATQINKDNVNDLKLAWTHRSGDFVAG